MTELTRDDILLHYGVKGMKWGKSSAGKSSDAKSSRTKARIDAFESSKNYAGAKGKRNAGLVVAASLLGTPVAGLAVASAISIRGQGHGRAKSVALAIVGGPISAVAVNELSARKSTREDD